MRRFVIGIVVLALCIALRATAQSVHDSLTLRRLPGNITLVLPANWLPLSDSTRLRIRNVLDTAFEHSRDSLLQAGLQYGRPMVLLHESAPGQPDPSASFNVA